MGHTLTLYIYMNKIRFSALKELSSHLPVKNTKAYYPSDVFGCDVLTLDKMQRYLSGEAFKQLQQIMSEGGTIDRNLADQVAAAMKTWALEKGVTHYTHWFHPLNGSTAEKHDSFIDVQTNGRIAETFDGRMLVQQEPDASSFPNGGIRNTFEARGYTAWDPGSPAFINNNTLCIPTVFVAYTGEALDYKTPLLKALSLIDKAAEDICQYFDKDVQKVIATLGWEQEYFLVDEALYNARPDLKLCGRTLMGHSAAKDQQLEDHYFGAIPERVNTFMDELEYVCHRLGIPVKTRHNEVAPNQFELAPIFEEANLAVDHNQLLMSTIKRVARHHHFRVLLHEKPYKGINGSGKHNNWSLLTDTGVNLLSPGKNPKSNMQFLVFLVCTAKAVLEHEALFKACIVSLGNERRLGGDEAPPVIMSVFLGQQLDSILMGSYPIMEGGDTLNFEITQNLDFLNVVVRTDDYDGHRVKLQVYENIPSLVMDTLAPADFDFRFTGDIKEEPQYGFSEKYLFDGKKKGDGYRAHFMEGENKVYDTFMAGPEAFGKRFIFDLGTPKVPAALLGYAFLNFSTSWPDLPTYPDPNADLYLGEMWHGYYFTRLPSKAKVYGTNENPETVDLSTCALLYTLDESNLYEDWRTKSWCKATDHYAGSGKNYRSASDTEFAEAEPICLRMLFNYSGESYRYLILVVEDTYNSNRWGRDSDENPYEYVTFDEIEVLVKAE